MKPTRGFTLFELMFTLAVVGSLLVIALPSLANLVQDNRLTGATNGFIADLNLARTEAMKRGHDVAMCRTNTPNATTPTCANGAGWETGWVIFDNADGDEVVDPGEIIAVHNALDTGVTLRGNAHVADHIGFRPSGAVAGSNGTLGVCVDGYDEARRIVLSMVGRVRTERADSTPANCRTQ